MVLLWVTGVTKGSFVLFLGTLLCAAMGLAWLVASTVWAKEPLRAARAAVVVVLAAAVPVIFDPHTGDVFNLPKYTITVLGALVLLGLWAISMAHHRALPRWRNGLQWLVGALVAWTAISALTSIDVRVSLLGNYGSYDGLYSAAAFGVIMMCAAEAFDVDDVRRALQALGFAGGSVVAIYGLVQLHDSEAHGPKWDFIDWHNGSFANQVFSTFGNPNHLAGFLAISLPVMLVIGLGSRRWVWRAVAGVFTLIALTELARSAARGAWLAAIAAVLTLAVMLAPELRKRLPLVLGATGAVVVVAVVTLARYGNRFLHVSLSSLFASGGTSTVEQRDIIWRTAAHVAVHNPIAGTGPDTFALVYQRQQSATWVKDFGPNYLVNGAHDIFMNILADQGFVGLVLFLALLAYAAFRAIGAWRRLRHVEHEESTTVLAHERARANRALLAVVAASIVAYVVQAVFNVQQVGLSFSFWLLVGLLTVVAHDAGVPETLQPAVLLSATASPEHGEPRAGASRTTPGAPHALWADRSAARRHNRSHFDWGAHWPTIAAAVVATALVVLLCLGADAPYRADHDYWSAASGVETAGSTSTTQVGQQFFNGMRHAMSLNPWEPTYPAYEASVYENLARGSSTSAEAVGYLEDARSMFAKAASIEPRQGQYVSSEAGMYLEIADLAPTQAKTDLARAISLARKAVGDNPRDTEYVSLVASIATAQSKAGK